MTPLKVMHLPLRDTLADYAKDEVDQRIHRIALLLRPEAGITHSGRRPSDDLRRLRTSADLRARRPRLCAARRGRPFHRRARHRPPRQAAAEHQWRRSFVHAFRNVRHVRIAGERAPDARHRPAQIPGARISVCHGVGGMFAASGTIIMTNAGS
jgi:hypothetical protein